MHEKEHQTDTEKLKKLTSELSSIHDKRRCGQGTTRVVRQREQGRRPQGAVQIGHSAEEKKRVG